MTLGTSQEPALKLQVDFSLARFAWLTVINEDQLEPCSLTIIIHLIKLNMIVLAFKCVFVQLKFTLKLHIFLVNLFYEVFVQFEDVSVGFIISFESPMCNI